MAFSCLDEARRHGFDLAFVDLKLGEDDGMQLLPELLAGSPRMKIVVITAHAAIKRAVEAMRRGVTGFIAKPFTPEQLRLLVWRMVGVRMVGVRMVGVRVPAKAASLQQAAVSGHRSGRPGAGYLCADHSARGQPVAPAPGHHPGVHPGADLLGGRPLHRHRGRLRHRAGRGGYGSVFTRFGQLVLLGLTKLAGWGW
ncbi:response regulator [Megalodesulfovibrio paquesii]